MSGLPIQCPACGMRYLLPHSLLGEAGASVRCPSCAHEFAVDVDGGLVGSAPDLRALARRVLDELGGRLGPALATAAEERRLFADHGPALLEAWEEFRRLAGSGAASHAFREELRERFGVELFPPGGE